MLLGLLRIDAAEVHIGIEDGQLLPPDGQRIDKDLPDKVVKRLNELTVNVGLVAERKVSGGGEYIVLTVFMSKTSVASTTTGQYSHTGLRLLYWKT